MEDQIVNKVSQSSLITIDLEEFYTPGKRIVFDIKGFLFQELILREKDFREALKNHDWKIYADTYVSLICSADAIVPTWAYMLIAAYLEPYAKRIIFGDLETLETILYQEVLSQLPFENYKDARIVIKGCGNLPVPKAAYVELTRLLRPLAKSIMYGEPCSTVPIFKQAK